MSGYVLCGGEFTRTLITQMVMAEGGIDYELRQVDILRHEHKSSEFLSINPAGLIPALVTPEGDVLYETFIWRIAISCIRSHRLFLIRIGANS
ncbi:MAG: glutathione S-transferase N-terminal domain-containing protein [Arenicellales bacterium]